MHMCALTLTLSSCAGHTFCYLQSTLVLCREREKNLLNVNVSEHGFFGGCHFLTQMWVCVCVWDKITERSLEICPVMPALLDVGYCSSLRCFKDKPLCSKAPWSNWDSVPLSLWEARERNSNTHLLYRVNKKVSMPPHLFWTVAGYAVDWGSPASLITVTQVKSMQTCRRQDNYLRLVCQTIRQG